MLCEIKSPYRVTSAGLLGPGQAREDVALIIYGERDLRSKLLIVTLCLAIHGERVLPLLENLVQATDGLLRILKNGTFRHINYFPDEFPRLCGEGGARALYI